MKHVSGKALYTANILSHSPLQVTPEPRSAQLQEEAESYILIESKLSHPHLYDYKPMRELKKRTGHVRKSLNTADLNSQISVSAIISFFPTGKQEMALHLQVNFLLYSQHLIVLKSLQTETLHKGEYMARKYLDMRLNGR